jgi:UDP:flavonoid glycosyltransferase YjiC (YdhE family)
MRVLFTTRGSAGHLGPLVPYATACRRAGHDVLVAAQDRFEMNVARTGLPFAPLGAPPDEEWMPLLPEFARMRLDEGHERMVAEFFGALDVRAMLPGLRALTREWRPDLIVRESWEYASPLVAEEHGIPIARVGLGVAAVEDVSDRAAGRIGTEPYLTSIPLALEDPAVPLPRQTLRFRGAEVPPSAPGEGEPLVYVSFGSVTAGGHLPFYPALYRAVIEALAPLSRPGASPPLRSPARFLLTIGEERDHAELGALPPNVTVERWVPQDEVLHRAAAVVTHGGLGSTLGALAHGVPLVVLPLFSLDQWYNAAAVARAGAGVALDAERHTRRGVALPSADTLAALRPAVEHVLTDSAPRQAALKVAAEIRGLPPVEAAVSALEKIVT